MLKFERSNEVSPIHSLNIPYIFVTLEVLKLETSNEVSPLQPQNIPYILVTLEVLKLETSNEVSLLQYINIPPISVTREVLNPLPKSIVVMWSVMGPILVPPLISLVNI